jgi:hypothetical protein
MLDLHARANATEHPVCQPLKAKDQYRFQRRMLDRSIVPHEIAACGSLLLGLLGLLCLAGCTASPAARVTNATGFPRFVVSFPADVHPEPITARVLLFFSRSGRWEPRYASGFFNLRPVYAIDVNDLHPGAAVVFSPEQFHLPDALAFPENFNRLDAGTYYVQALIDLDETRPEFYAGPGNLYSRVARCTLARPSREVVELIADQVTEEEPPREDTDRVKLVQVHSKLLSGFHGREVGLRAGVILPATYNENPDRQFPALYIIPGFGGDHTSAWRQANEEQELMLRVVLDPKVPLGHSVFANSANNGPVGDALVQELIPEIEKRFRAIPHPYGRFVTGHSSGGWASLWLQVTYPDFFAGCWSLAPDPVDFTRFQTMNIYEDHNGHWTREGYPRPLARDGEKVAQTFAQLNRWEYVTGPGFQLDSFNAVFSPRGTDGKPRPLMDKLTGVIDPEVAQHWKRYDIRRTLEENWASLGPKLKGKLHIVAGAWDTFYLETAVEELRDFLETTDYEGYVEILPGSHGSFRTAEFENRIDLEMAEHFAAGEKAYRQAHSVAEPPAP